MTKKRAPNVKRTTAGSDTASPEPGAGRSGKASSRGGASPKKREQDAGEVGK